MIDFQAPLAGMNNASASLDSAATKIALGSQNVARASPGDTVDLSAEIITLLEARNDFRANASFAHTLDDMTKRLLNAIG